MKKLIVAPLVALALAHPSIAAAPQFQTAAPIAYMEDLSSGAVLYNKGGDQRMPPVHFDATRHLARVCILDGPRRERPA